jgi:hypothetical protein
MPVINKKYTKSGVRNRLTVVISKPANVFSFMMCQSVIHVFSVARYEGNSVSKLQIQVATYVFELSAGNCHR